MNRTLMMTGKMGLAIAGLVALTALPTPAHAFDFSSQAGETTSNSTGQPHYQVEITANDIGKRFPVRWQLPSSGEMTNLAATAEFKVVSLSSDRLVLDITLTNDTTAAARAAITSFGFGITPNVSHINLSAIENNTATFGAIAINDRQQVFSGRFNDVDVCIFAATTCSGGSMQEGLQSGGNLDAVRVELDGDFGGTPRATLTSFPVKFQTTSGSVELAGTFADVDTAQMPDDEADDETATELPNSVATEVRRHVAREANVDASDVRIVETRRETWTDGCLGLGTLEMSCSAEMVPGWLVVAASEEQEWVYRTNETGSVVVMDSTATSTRMAQMRTETRTEQRVSRTTTTQQGQVNVTQGSEEREQHSTTGSSVEVQQRTQQAQVNVQQTSFSQTVQTAVFEAIAQRTQVSVSSLRVVEARRQIWSDGCLGLNNGRSCTQAQVPGWLTVVSNGQQYWVYRTNESGSVVEFDEVATTLRMAQVRAHSSGTRVTFVDVASNYWARDYIAELAALDIIAGYPDGRYRPEQPVTRAEFAAIIRRAFEVTEVRNAVNFSDVEQRYWAYTAIQESYKMGFLNVVSGNQFNPLARLSRRDTLLALARGLRFTTTSSVASVLSVYQDARLSSTEEQMLLAALTEQGIVVNYPDVRVLNLDRVSTRAEVAVLVYQTLASLGRVQTINSSYAVPGNTVVIGEPNPNGSDGSRRNCNQGIGNGAEGCDPGNSSPHGGSNDEGGRTPGGNNR